MKFVKSAQVRFYITNFFSYVKVFQGMKLAPSERRASENFIGKCSLNIFIYEITDFGSQIRLWMIFLFIRVCAL